MKSPWYHLSIDFVGPLPESANGNQYSLTLSDYCTKWVDAVALPSKCAFGVADALFKVSVYLLVCVCMCTFHCMNDWNGIRYLSHVSNQGGVLQRPISDWLE